MGTVTVLPRGREFTRRDLERMPDDGRRYEIIDGVLLVTSAPSIPHQRVLARLYTLLAAHCPDDLEVLFAPLDVALADDTVMQPDLLVARKSDFTVRDLPVAPLLAVEVLSPSTRRLDLTLKRARLEAAGCASYWAVDPDEPAVTVWRLRDGRYDEATHVAGAERAHLDAPYSVVICPAELVG